MLLLIDGDVDEELLLLEGEGLDEDLDGLLDELEELLSQHQYSHQ
tara:strand:- start:995 stop:1129 length:135 start_codon:yes stop_codon:yes gene_type:complete